MRYIICAPPYHPKHGGGIVLHSLCDLINRLGGDARLCLWTTAEPHPFWYSDEDSRAIARALYEMAWSRVEWLKKRWRRSDTLTHPSLRTPLISTRAARQATAIVVYSEVIGGNPLCAKHVVRWCLHRPGHFSKQVWYGTDDLLVDYGTFLSGFRIEGMTVRQKPLNLFYSPNLALYLHTPRTAPSPQRAGSAYLIKKGHGKPLVHDLRNSILIDDLPHEEIIRVFDSVETFYAYDTYSMYSVFAAARGAVSIVIPDPGISEADWYPSEEMRLGVGYGLGQADYSRATMGRAVRRLQDAETRALQDVREFMNDVEAEFAARARRQAPTT